MIFSCRMNYTSTTTTAVVLLPADENQCTHAALQVLRREHAGLRENQLEHGVVGRFLPVDQVLNLSSRTQHTTHDETAPMSATGGEGGGRCTTRTAPMLRFSPSLSPPPHRRFLTDDFITSYSSLSLEKSTNAWFLSPRYKYVSCIYICVCILERQA